MKNVLLYMARGLEGCGITTYTKNLKKGFQRNNINCDIAIDTSFDFRRNSFKNFIKENNVLKTKFIDNKFIDFDNYDCIILTSVPPKRLKKVSEEKYHYFIDKLREIKNNGTKIISLQCDHSIQSINRNFYAIDSVVDDFFEIVDLFVTHYEGSHLERFIEIHVEKENQQIAKDKIVTQNMCCLDFNQDFNFNFNEKIDKSIYFIGRSAKNKGYNDLINLFKQKCLDEDNDYLVFLDGCESSISSYTDFFDIDEKTRKRTPKPYMKYYNRSQKKDNSFEKFKDEIIENSLQNEDVKNKIYVFEEYLNQEGLKRMNRFKFGFFGTFYGNHTTGCVENTLLEIINCRTIPIVKKEFWNILSLTSSKKECDLLKNQVSSPKDAGLIIFDKDNPESLFDTLEKINKDEKLYNEYLNNGYSTFSKYFSPEFQAKEMLNKINNI